MRSTVLWLAVALVALTPAKIIAQEPPALVLHYADIVLYNGEVQTVDRETPDWTVAEAVAIRDGEFLAVGATDEILPLAGPRTVRIDLKGRTVTPGFIDTHSHLTDYARIPSSVSARLGRVRLPARNASEKGKALQQLEVFARTLPEGHWIEASAGNDVVRAFTLQDLDQAAPRNPVYVGGSPSYGAVNSLALKALWETYPDIDGVERGRDGQPTGQVETPVMGTIMAEFIPAIPLDVAADAYKREMDRWLGGGITTISSSIRNRGAEISALKQLERSGRMTVRFAYAHQWLMDNPNWRAFVKRIGDVVGGSDQLWSVGASSISIDGGGGGGMTGCMSIPEIGTPAAASGPFGDCRALPGMPRYEAIKGALRDGIRVSGLHAGGDHGIGMMLDLFLELQAEGVPMAELRPNLDHCKMLSAANIQKARQLEGMIFSCAAKYILDGHGSAEKWGKEVTDNWGVPIKGLLDAGVKVVWEVDTSGTFEGSDEAFPLFHPMLQMQLFVTRRGIDGTVWGAKHAIDKRMALLMMTRWGAEYVLREDRLGSIEPGKLADLAVFDGDWTASADNRLVDLAALMTIVGGKVVYVDDAFADTVGRQVLAGVQHPFSAVYPAYRPSEAVRQWADGTRSANAR